MERTGVGTVCLWILVVIVVVRGQNYVNVARDKTYNQSSFYSTQSSARNGANGDTAGIYSDSNCIHTAVNDELYPWWEVDLGGNYPVYNIDIWARTGVEHRAYPSTITVDNKQCASIPYFSSRQKTVTCSSILNGRKVRFTRDSRGTQDSGDRTLNLCEMQIWVCRNGWFGQRCSATCSPGCPSTACDRQTGQCSPCKAGYTGSTCTDCEDKYYKTNSGTCDSCSTKCLNQLCDKATSKCNGCVSGQQGDQCSIPCSTGCLNDVCQQSGQCSPCKHRFYGNQCSTPCPTGCLNTCDQQSGKCSSCKDGKYGDQCSTPCPTGCLNACDQQSGKCSSCKDGWYGDQCPTPCPDGCLNACDQQSGKCSSCKDGWYGEQCSTRCPTGCLNACDQQSGKCSSCKDRWYGDQCSTRCPAGCLNDTCQQSGLCSPCKTGFMGRNCSECQDKYYGNSSMCAPCSSNCRLMMCDKNTGSCEDCNDGRYGDMCDSLCQTDNCRKCDQKTGMQCIECTLFLKHPACTECLDEYYKQSTSSNCSKCTGSCKSGTVCDKTTGFCAQCPPGKQGNYCDQDIKEGNTGAIVGAVIAVIVVIVIVVLIVIFVMRRRKHAAKSNTLETEMSRTAQNRGEVGRGQEDNGGPGSSPLSFAPIIITNDMKDTKPKAQVKPATKPTVQPKPAKAADSIYENVALTPQTSASSSTPSTSNQNRTTNNAHRSQSELLTDDEELDSLWNGEEPVYFNDPSYTNIIRLDQLQKTIVDSLEDSKIADEFQFLVGFKEFPVDNARRQENYYKNRFKSIVPYDKNRVVLKQVNGDDSSDYVNASFIKGYKTDKAYIAAQGPRPNTQDDFWRMIWQEGITDIVMLTNLKEGNKLKCHEYWPAKGKSLNTGHVEISCQDEEERAHYVIRTFSVGKPQSKEKRQVRQYHYVKWMDHEVPATTPLVDFWRYVRARAPRTATAPPLLVHCSAGVGRTGTFIALDILIDQSQQDQEISIYSTVDSLRNYRCHMVQNKGQYEFLHEAFLEAYMAGDSRLKSPSFDNTFPTTIRHDQPHPRIDAEYKKLCQMRTCLIHPSHGIASQEENRRKNRNPNALPDDKYLVFITEHSKGRNQYINAVYMPTFLSSRGSIVTQLPLADTVIDLWRLVDSWDVNTIVSIGNVDGQQGHCRYWPKSLEETLKSGAYTIRTKSMTSAGETVRSYTLEMKKESKSRELRVLHYEAWTGEVADNISDLINLLDTLQTAHKQSTKQPVIIQCIDGAAKSGALCALWDIISRVTYDDDVDVYLAVRHVHTARPEAITSVTQYRFLYEVVQEYKLSHSVYANT